MTGLPEEYTVPELKWTTTEAGFVTHRSSYGGILFNITEDTKHQKVVLNVTVPGSLDAVFLDGSEDCETVDQCKAFAYLALDDLLHLEPLSRVMRTERGWASHYCNNFTCGYRRSTLLEFGKQRVIVSSVGREYNDKNEIRPLVAMSNPIYESMIFPARESRVDGEWVIDARKALYPCDALFIEDVKAPGSPENTSGIRLLAQSDAMADKMHEKTVTAVMEHMMKGTYLPKKDGTDERMAR